MFSSCSHNAISAGSSLSESSRKSSIIYVNCGEDHPSSSKACPKYKEEQEIISLKYTLNISFPEARKIIQHKPVLYASIATKHTKEIGTQTSFPAQPFTFTFTTPNTSQSTPTPPQPTSQSTKHSNTPSSSTSHSQTTLSQDEMTSLSNR